MTHHNTQNTMSDEFREGDGGASGGHGALGSDHGLPQTRDFADTLSPTPFEVSSIRSSPVDSPNIIDHPSPHVQYSLNVDTSPPEPPNRADTQTPFSPSLRRRATRAATFRTVSDFEDFSERPGWHPGAEPGVDPSKPDGGRSSMTTLRAPCEITVVDFSEDNFSMQRLDNDSLNVFMRLPTPGWVKCRWINVNRLSWDVIQALGTHKNLHRLAIEDIMNTRNRTKVEWYPSHAFIVLTLQKLVRRYDSESEDSDSDSDDDATSRTSKRSSVSGRTRKRFKRLLRRLKKTFQGNGRDASDSSGLELGSGPYRERGTDEEEDKEGIESRSTGLSDISEPEYRTLQGYHASPNLAWTKYMENNSALGSKNLDVGCEQVSMFITNDNSIISFFEQSAQDIEEPIVRRLQTVDTITRQSCDASMVAHAILDAIIDLAMPVTMCYSDVIDDIELDVLNRPDISQTKHLYIVVSEINKMLSFISPITTLIQALREHTVDVPLDAAMRTILDPQHPAIITSQTYMYLGDVLDHCVLITDTLNKLKGSADGMINLIFNTISANQNESMKQLTIATIIFLPLTFITGYFGQNFEPFGMLNQGIGVFWKISVPVVLFTIAVLLREPIYDYWQGYTSAAAYFRSPVSIDPTQTQEALLSDEYRSLAGVKW